MKTIIISNRLPVKVTEDDEGLSLKQSEGGLATGLGSIYRQGDNIWIGWPGVEISTEEQKHEVSEKLSELNLRPVFLSKEEVSLYYEGFSNEVLWPVFHYHPTYARYEETFWNAYVSVNKKFKQAVMEFIEPDDVIWIHDYQLLLLAGMIRQERSDVTIGFFLHIPFPSYELFRLIPWRSEILNGMLGADLLGFHTFDDARHFISAATRILPVNSFANVINQNDRQIVVDSFPMGIDDKRFENLTKSPEVQETITTLRTTFEGIKMVLSIDRLDYSKGILQRLHAFEKLLKDNPEYIDKVILYMIVVPSRDTVPQYKELRDEIDKIVGNINSCYRTLNWLPVHYYYRSFPAEMLSALYYLADVCLISPMRDGMNLVSKEYVASRTNNTGVLILSEMAGAAKELTEALIVNPNSINEIYSAILQGLNMTKEEQQLRMGSMRQTVSKFNIQHWVKIYMDRLEKVKQLQRSMQTKHVGSATLKAIEDKYIHSAKRVIFLDYDGTLVGFHTNIDMASPDEELYSILAGLTADPANKLVLISGRKQETMEKWFGHLPIELIAEHGVWQKRTGHDWTQLPGLYNQWKQDVKSIMETYVDRTPGSFIEEKSFSLVWHYRKVETGLGDLRANELMSDLRFITADKGLQLLPGSKVLEVKNIEVNKGKVALSLLNHTDYDFIMALGDDHTDEDLFKAFPERAITIKIGNQISAAKYYLRDFREARRLLRALSLKKSAVES